MNRVLLLYVHTNKAIKERTNMADHSKDFQEQFLEKYKSEETLKKLDDFMDLGMCEEHDENAIIDGWVPDITVEKHDCLNYTYHFQFRREEKERENETINLSFYTGINVGCELVDFSFEGKSLANQPHYIEEFSHIEINWSKYLLMHCVEKKEDLPPLVVKKIENLFNNNKDEIEKIIGKESYDNYVTGGGTVKTDSHYRNLFAEYNAKGIFWERCYQTVEVDRNFV